LVNLSSSDILQAVVAEACGLPNKKHGANEILNRYEWGRQSARVV